MKKSLFSLAVFAVAGMAHAQSSVHLYGNIDAALTSTKTTVPGFFGEPETQSVRGVDSGGLSSSYWGIKGSEDLGRGLRANFKLENGFRADTGEQNGIDVQDPAFGREAWVGLSSDTYGALQIGRTINPLEDVFDRGNDSFNSNFSAATLAWKYPADYSSNSIKYTSPTWNGLSASVSVAMDEDALQPGSAGARSLAIHYDRGPFSVSYGYLKQDELLGFNPMDPTQVIEGDTKYKMLAASYDFGVAKVKAGVGRVTASDPSMPEFTEKDKQYNLGVEVPVSNSFTLAAGIAQSKHSIGGIQTEKTKAYSVSGKYAFSKRTSAYAFLAQSKTTDTFLAIETRKVRTFGVGLNHAF